MTNIPIGKIGWIKPDDTHGYIDAKPWINSIAVTRDGKWLYWGTCLGDDELWRYPLGKDGLPSGEAELIQQNLGWSNSMDPSNDGHIDSPLNLYGDIRKINPETGEITKVYTDLEFPSACDIDESTGLLKPHSTVAQTLDGTIYFTEPGATSFSVLRPQN